MTDPERVKLLFGPYQAPALRRGDRATCIFRDATVVITGWTDARIPWPRCRSLDSPGGRSGLLVDDELARAVRHESAATVKHWWGASGTAVNHWRKALGVTRTGNAGTARLVGASAVKGAAAIKARVWTDEERRQRRRRNAEKRLHRNLIPGSHGPRWTAADVALVGTMPDERVAWRIGRTPNAARQKRGRLGIANPLYGRRRADRT
jgi:hypothetical protein